MPSLELAELEARRAMARLLDASNKYPTLSIIKAIEHIIEHLQEQEEFARKERSKWLKNST